MAWREADCIICGARFGWMYTGGVPRNVCSDNCRKKRKSRRSREYYLENVKNNPELYREIKDRANRRYRENKEQLKAQAREYYHKNKDKESFSNRRRKYRKENAEQIREYRAKYYRENKEFIRLKHKEYRKANPDVIHQQHARRRARIMGAFVENVDRGEVLSRDDWTCGICGGEIPKNALPDSPLYPHVDHIVPLSRGGKHSYDNVQASHASCNMQKHANEVKEGEIKPNV